MKLLKFNLIFIPFLALCLGVVGYIACGSDCRSGMFRESLTVSRDPIPVRHATTERPFYTNPGGEVRSFKSFAAASRH
jgi:hypothetical protein